MLPAGSCLLVMVMGFHAIACMITLPIMWFITSKIMDGSLEISDPRLTSRASYRACLC